MRKQIDLDEDVKMRLEIMAVKAGKDLKNYIQDILVQHSKAQE